MEKCAPSIFNDVIGPVMRGPSSSHVAAAARIGKLLRMSTHNKVKHVVVDFDTNGSLAESYHGHGSDIGFASGVLGIELTDPRVPKAIEIAKGVGVDIKFNILDYGALHPNNYRMEMCSSDGIIHKWEAISVGGGMIEMQKFDNFDISICGDFYEFLITCDITEIKLSEIKNQIEKVIGKYEYIFDAAQKNKGFINVKTQKNIDKFTIKELYNLSGIVDIITLQPVLPTQSSATCKVPFTSASDLLKYAKEDTREMWEMAVLYESKRGNTTEQDVFEKMDDIVSIMINCVKEGLAGTEYKDRILGPQAYKIESGVKNNILVPSDILNNVIKSITAIMEVKSSMGVIVAAPTAGSCGCLPGTLIGIGETLNLSKEDITKAMLVAGLIGVFIAEGATFAAEVAGCQVECGAGSGMAAAGIAQLFHGTVKQCVDASSIALQNLTGLACDPVANRVEIPCLGKNVMGGSNAIVSANMVLAGFDKVIPLDETIKAMYDIGKMLPIELRCTLGGLGKTCTSFKIRDCLS